MAQRFQCPACGQSYAWKDGLAGKQATCKKCGKSFRIEAANTSAPTAEPIRPTDSAAAQPTPPVSREADSSVGEVAALPKIVQAGPDRSTGRSSVKRAVPKTRTASKKRLLVIASSAAGALLLLIVILLFVFNRDDAPGTFVDEPTTVAGGKQQQESNLSFGPSANLTDSDAKAVDVPAEAPVKGQRKAAVTATTDVPPGVIAPADVDHRTAGGMKTPEQLFDDLAKYFDAVPTLLGEIRDEATLQDAIPKVSEQISKINDVLSVLRSSAMYGQRMSPELANQIKEMEKRFGDRLKAEIIRLQSNPGAPKIAEEFQKFGRTHPVELPKRPDAEAMAALPPEEQIKWHMRSRAASEVYAFVFEGLLREDLPRIERRLGSFRNQGSPTFFDDNRCVKYVSRVNDPNRIVRILNVGDARVNQAKRVVIIQVDSARIKQLR